MISVAPPRKMKSSLSWLSLVRRRPCFCRSDRNSRAAVCVTSMTSCRRSCPSGPPAGSCARCEPRRSGSLLPSWIDVQRRLLPEHEIDAERSFPGEIDRQPLLVRLHEPLPDLRAVPLRALDDVLALVMRHEIQVDLLRCRPRSGDSCRTSAPELSQSRFSGDIDRQSSTRMPRRRKASANAMR